MENIISIFQFPFESPTPKKPTRKQVFVNFKAKPMVESAASSVYRSQRSAGGVFISLLNGR
jgi:hypothetical protein